LGSRQEFKHPANPTGLDEDDKESHKVPHEAQKISGDNLAKGQGTKSGPRSLQLPAAETVKRLFDRTDP
jgi:hypothetical protein